MEENDNSSQCSSDTGNVRILRNRIIEVDSIKLDEDEVENDPEDNSPNSLKSKSSENSDIDNKIGNGLTAKRRLLIGSENDKKEEQNYDKLNGGEKIDDGSSVNVRVLRNKIILAPTAKAEEVGSKKVESDSTKKSSVIDKNEETGICEKSIKTPNQSKSNKNEKTDICQSSSETLEKNKNEETDVIEKTDICLNHNKTPEKKKPNVNEEPDICEKSTRTPKKRDQNCYVGLNKIDELPYFNKNLGNMIVNDEDSGDRSKDGETDNLLVNSVTTDIEKIIVGSVSNVESIESNKTNHEMEDTDNELVIAEADDDDDDCSLSGKERVIDEEDNETSNESNEEDKSPVKTKTVVEKGSTEKSNLITAGDVQIKNCVKIFSLEPGGEKQFDGREDDAHHSRERIPEVEEERDQDVCDREESKQDVCDPEENEQDICDHEENEQVVCDHEESKSSVKCKPNLELEELTDNFDEEDAGDKNVASSDETYFSNTDLTEKVDSPAYEEMDTGSKDNEIVNKPAQDHQTEKETSPEFDPSEDKNEEGELLKVDENADNKSDVGDSNNVNDYDVDIQGGSVENMHTEEKIQENDASEDSSEIEIVDDFVKGQPNIPKDGSSLNIGNIIKYIQNNVKDSFLTSSPRKVTADDASKSKICDTLNVDSKDTPKKLTVKRLKYENKMNSPKESGTPPSPEIRIQPEALKTLIKEAVNDALKDLKDELLIMKKDLAKITTVKKRKREEIEGCSPADLAFDKNDQLHVPDKKRKKENIVEELMAKVVQIYSDTEKSDGRKKKKKKKIKLHKRETVNSQETENVEKNNTTNNSMKRNASPSFEEMFEIVNKKQRLSDSKMPDKRMDLNQSPGTVGSIKKRKTKWKDNKKLKTIREEDKKTQDVNFDYFTPNNIQVDNNDLQSRLAFTSESSAFECEQSLQRKIKKKKKKIFSPTSIDNSNSQDILYFSPERNCSEDVSKERKIKKNKKNKNTGFTQNTSQDLNSSLNSKSKNNKLMKHWSSPSSKFTSRPGSFPKSVFGVNPEVKKKNKKKMDKPFGMDQPTTPEKKEKKKKAKLKDIPYRTTLMNINK